MLVEAESRSLFDLCADLRSAGPKCSLRLTTKTNASEPLRVQCMTNETGSVYVPLVVGLNFQFDLTHLAAALASMGGPDPSASTILPA